MIDDQNIRRFVFLKRDSFCLAPFVLLDTTVNCKGTLYLPSGLVSRLLFGTSSGVLAVNRKLTQLEFIVLCRSYTYISSFRRVYFSDPLFFVVVFLTNLFISLALFFLLPIMRCQLYLYNVSIILVLRSFSSCISCFLLTVFKFLY